MYQLQLTEKGREYSNEMLEGEHWTDKLAEVLWYLESEGLEFENEALVSHAQGLYQIFCEEYRGYTGGIMVPEFETFHLCITGGYVVVMAIAPPDTDPVLAQRLADELEASAKRLREYKVSVDWDLGSEIEGLRDLLNESYNEMWKTDTTS